MRRRANRLAFSAGGLIRDSFTDADGTTLVSHAGESAVAWRDHGLVSTGVATIDGNRVHTTTQGNFGIVMARRRTRRYCRVACDIVVITDDNTQGAGFMARHEPVQRTGFLIRVRLDTNVWEFSWAIDAAGIVIASVGFTPVNGTAYRVELDVRAGRCRAIVDGAEIASSVFAPNRHLATYAGIRVGTNSVNPSTTGPHLDNWMATR